MTITEQLAAALREAEPVDDYIRGLVRLANTLSHEEWRWGQFARPDGSPIETVDHVCEAQEHSARQSDTAQLWGVDLGVDRPVVCYTGNGPRSERHAQYIAVVRPQVVIWILNELGERIERLTRERDAARAAIAALQPQDGWQDIATAPRDSQLILGHSEQRWIRFGRYYPEYRKWYYSGTNERQQYNEEEGGKPTHWRPLPPAPATQAKG